MNKFTFGGGVSMAMAAFALSATVALACPPKQTPPPSNGGCPPVPCGSCGCNVSTNAAFATFSQNQVVHGIKDPQGWQTATGTLEVNVGKQIEAKTTFDLSNVAKADAATFMSQNQGGTFGASAIGPPNNFPGFWTAKTQGIAQHDATTNGINVRHEQDMFTWQHSIVDGVKSSLDVNLHQKKLADGLVKDAQSLNSGTQAQWWAVPPFPKSHTFDFFLGNNKGFLFQQIDLVNKLVFM